MYLLEQFKEYLFSQKKAASKITVKNYLADIRQFIRWYENEFKTEFIPQAITLQIIEIYRKYRTAESVSTRTFKRHQSSLRKFFSFLKDQNLILVNPFEKLYATPYPLYADFWHLTEFKKYLVENNKSHLTIKNYLSDLSQFKQWVEKVTGSKNPEVITRTLIEEYKKRLLEKAASPLSINRKLSSIRSYLNFIPFTITKKSAFASQKISNVIVSENPRVHLGGVMASSASWRTQPATSEVIYSRIPPVRLIQKTFKGLNFLFDSTIIEPLADTFEEIDYQWWKMRGKKIFSKNVILNEVKNPNQGKRSFANAQDNILNLPKSFYSPLTLSTSGFPIHKKLFHHLKYTRPNWYKQYHSLAISHYFHISILVILMTLTGVSFYFTLNPKTNENEKSVLGEISTSRVLSFSGKLADSLNTPITTKKLVRFSIYNSPTASGSALFWQEVNSVEPDKDGNFSVLLGNAAMGGAPIADSVFLDNPSLWLGIAVENENETMPREPIATTSLSSDSKTVGGLTPITKPNAGTDNVLLALDSSGNLTIGGSSDHAFEATGGQFKISGQTLLLATSPGTSTDVVIAPDGFGKIDLQKPLYNSLTNSIQIQGRLSLAATESAQAAFSLNQDSSGDLISASVSGIPRFVINNTGGGYFADSVKINSLTNEVMSLSSKGATESGMAAYQTFGDNNTKYFKVGLNAAAPSPFRVAFDITNESSGSSLLTILPSGNVGIGVLNPSYQLQLASDSAAKPVSGTWTIISDQRLKEGIKAFTDGLSVINKINPVSYILNGKANTPKGAKGIGIIAQDIKDIIPYTVSTFKAKLNPDDKADTELFNFDQSALTFILINAVKELSAKVDNQLSTLNSQRIISPLAEIDEIHTNVISPLAGNSVTIHLPDETDKHLEGENVNSDGGRFIIENATGSAVASIDSLGNVYAEGSLSARSASFSGELSASTISASNIQTSDASVAGTLRADRIIANNIEGLDALASPSQTWRSQVASLSSNLNVAFATFNQGLIALGPSSLSDTAVTGQLSIGSPLGGLILAQNSINVLGNDLQIQPLKQGGISFLAGAVRIDSDGNLKVEGNMRVNGALTANIISPLPNQDMIIQVSTPKEQFRIQNSTGSAVLSVNQAGDITSSGSANFTSVLTKGLNIVRSVAADTSMTETIATASAGTAIITQGETERTIITPFVTDKSLIYLTPASDTGGSTPYIARQTSSSFTIQIPQRLNKDLNVNWWIVN